MSNTLSNSVYDKLKFVALVVLPAMGAAYFSLANLWDLPNAEQVVGTITIIDTLLGGVLKLSSTRYRNGPEVIDGDLVVRKLGDTTQMLLVANKGVEKISGKTSVNFRVVNQKAPPEYYEDEDGADGSV